MKLTKQQEAAMTVALIAFAEGNAKYRIDTVKPAIITRGVQYRFEVRLNEPGDGPPIHTFDTQRAAVRFTQVMVLKGAIDAYNEAMSQEHKRAFETLTRSIEAEGFDVMVDVNGTYSVRERDTDKCPQCDSVVTAKDFECRGCGRQVRASNPNP